MKTAEQLASEMDKTKKMFPLYITKDEREEIERRRDASGFPSLNSYIVAVAKGQQFMNW